MSIKHNKKTVNTNRRKTLVGAIGVAGVATVWKTPLINSVILPAHAQTSAATTNFFGAAVSASPTVKIERSPLDLLMQPAYAGEIIPGEYTITVEQTTLGGDTFDIGVFERQNRRGFDTAEVVYRGQATTGAGGDLAVEGNPCELKVQPLAVEIGDVNADSIVLNFPERGQTVTVTAGDGILPMPMCVESIPGSFSLIDFNLDGDFYSMTAVRQSTTVYTITFQYQNDDFRWQGDLSVNGGDGNLGAQFDCAEFGGVDARIDSVSSNQLVLSVDLDGFTTFTLFPGLFPLPDICIRD